MAIVTLCPQCQTAFAIQAEHYSAADAWVRCGRCAHVFEVDQHLFELDGEPVAHATDVQASAPTPAPAVALVSAVTPTPFHHGIGVAILLAVLLGLQGLMHWRHHLASTEPALLPLLTHMCRPLSCDVHMPISPEQVSMETGVFQRIDADLYAFAGVIKNLGDFPVMMPSLELTLTDDNEAVVIRKIITPLDMGLTDSLRAARSQSFEFTFMVDPAFSPRINGYRSVLFYP
jgi:predicted Zn finger-like uncharacterized protein